MNKNRSGRQLNWDLDEIEALTRAVEESYKDIQFNTSKPKSSFSNLKRKRAWDSVADAVNSINGGRCIRSVAECRNKWTALKHQAKKDNDSRRLLLRKTGGGSVDDTEDLPEWELKVLEMCGIEQMEGS